MKSSKKSTIWKSIAGLNNAAMEMVRGGVMLKDNPAKELCAALNAKFEDALKAANVTLSERSVERHLAKIVWLEGRGDLIKKFVANSRNFDRLYEYLKSVVPKGMIDAKAREFLGHTVTKSQGTPSNRVWVAC